MVWSSNPRRPQGAGAESLGAMVAICAVPSLDEAHRLAALLGERGIVTLVVTDEEPMPGVLAPRGGKGIWLTVPGVFRSDAIAVLQRNGRSVPMRPRHLRGSRAPALDVPFSHPTSNERIGRRPAESSSDAPHPGGLEGRAEIPPLSPLALEAPNPGPDLHLLEEEDDRPIEPTLPEVGAMHWRLVVAGAGIALGIVFQALVEYRLGARGAIEHFAASSAHPGEWWRVISAGFLHNGLEHVVWNALLALLAAPVLFGTHEVGAVVLTWLLASATGIALETLVSPGLVLGASAGNFGLVGLWAKGQLERSHLAALPRRERIRTVGLLILLIPTALSPVSASGAHIAVFAHAAGFVVGFACGYLFHRRLDAESLPLIRVRARWGMAVTLVAFGCALVSAWVALNGPSP